MEGFGLAVQAYSKRGLFVIEWLRELTVKVGRKMMVRLVKGAYWDTEIKQTQQLGLDEYPVYTLKSHSDLSYLYCAQMLLEGKHFLFPQFATHNAHSVAAVLHLAAVG